MATRSSIGTRRSLRGKFLRSYVLLGCFVATSTGSAGGYTIGLPAATGNAGKQITIYNSSTGTLTLTAGNFNTAYGAATTSIVLPANTCVTLECDGTSYSGLGGSGAIGNTVRPHAANSTPSDFVQITTSTKYSLPAGGTWVYAIPIQRRHPQGAIAGILAGGRSILTPSSSNAQSWAWRVQYCH